LGGIGVKLSDLGISQYLEQHDDKEGKLSSNIKIIFKFISFIALVFTGLLTIKDNYFTLANAVLFIESIVVFFGMFAFGFPYVCNKPKIRLL
jgi:magnesium-transporting ATPase (P-type)